MSLKQQIIVIKSLSGKRQKSTGMRVPRRSSLSYALRVCFHKGGGGVFSNTDTELTEKFHLT
jgi:hypothetical protein